MGSGTDRRTEDPSTEGAGPGGRRRPLKPLVVLSVLLAVAVAAVVVGGRRTQSPAEVAATAKPPPPSVITAAVERRVLQSKVTARATVSSSTTTDLECTPSGAGASTSASSAAKPVFTRAPLTPGTAIAEGQVLAEVNGRPVIVLQGDTPAFRELIPASRGADVTQLQAALTRLGFEPGEHDGVLGAGTQVALNAWYRSLGYIVVGPTRDEAEQLRTAKSTYDQAAAAQRQAQAALATASRRPAAAETLQAQGAVAQAQAQLTDAQQQGGDVRGAQLLLQQTQAALQALLAPPDVSVPTAALADANRALADAQQQFDEATATTGVKVPFCEVVFVAALPAVVDRPPAAQSSASGIAAGGGAAAGAGDTTSGGGSAGAATGGAAWARLAAGQLILQATVSSSDHDLVKIGMPVSFGEDGAGLTGEGSVSALEPAGRTATSTWQLSITPTQPLATSALGENVRLVVPVRSTEQAVLVVPLAAVSSRADGSVHVIKAAGAEQSDVSVRPGLSADGFVAVTPDNPTELGADDRVVVSQ